uniref:DSHCT domain-containing protein n=1 Tax=Elaeophora elaphi TaxID=1147741 RepID=A0A0R3RNH3_9BILA
MRRLEELLREMVGASKAIGNGDLETRFEEARVLLKRDIVFTAVFLKCLFFIVAEERLDGLLMIMTYENSKVLYHSVSNLEKMKRNYLAMQDHTRDGGVITVLHTIQGAE